VPTANANEGLVQPAPPGLLSLLNLKSRGQNPDTLSRELTAVLESLEWYLYGQVQSTGDSSTAIDNTGIWSAGYHGAGAGTTVPNNQIWFVHSTCAAIQDFSGAAGITINLHALQSGWTMAQSPAATLTNKFAVSHPGFTRAIAGALPATHIIAPSLDGFFAPPGSNAVAYYNGSWLGGGAPSIRNRVRYTPLAI